MPWPSRAVLSLAAAAVLWSSAFTRTALSSSGNGSSGNGSSGNGGQLEQPVDDNAQTPRQNQIHPQQTAPRLTAAQRQLATAFANEHHPELALLLLQMKREQPKAYRKTIAAIHSTAARLQELQQQGRKEIYEEELEFWKLESRIRLVVAQLARAADPQQEEQLKWLIERRFDRIIDQMETTQARLQRRLALQETKIKRFKDDYEHNVKQELIRLTNEAARLRAESESGSANDSSAP